MQYAGVFPVDSNDFPKLEESIKRVGFLIDITEQIDELLLPLAHAD
jgi:translation elongation factor EF-4